MHVAAPNAARPTVSHGSADERRDELWSKCSSAKASVRIS